VSLKTKALNLFQIFEPNLEKIWIKFELNLNKIWKKFKENLYQNKFKFNVNFEVQFNKHIIINQNTE
jgi:hypothetical protein